MAFCGECGTNVGEAKFCTNCGAAQSIGQSVGGGQQTTPYQQQGYQQTGYQQPGYPIRGGKRARQSRAQRAHFEGEQMGTGGAMAATILGVVLALATPAGIAWGYYSYDCGSTYPCHSWPTIIYGVNGDNPAFNFILMAIFAYLAFKIKGINDKQDPYEELLKVKSTCKKVFAVAFVVLLVMFQAATTWYYYSSFELGVAGYSSLILPWVSNALLKTN